MQPLAHNEPGPSIDEANASSSTLERENGTIELEKEEAFPPGPRKIVWYVGDVGQRTPLKRGQRIFNEERAGFFFAKLLTYHIVGGLQLQGTITRVVCVARNKMDQSHSNPEERV